MHVKTYTGATTSAVLARIKADLGPDAVILDTRETETDGKTEIVITAAVERGTRRSGNGGGGQTPANGRNGQPSANGTDAYTGAGTGWKSWQEEWASIKTHLLSLMHPELRLARLSPRQRTAVEFLEGEGVDAASLMAVYESLAPDPEASVLASLGELAKVRGWSAKNWPQKVHLVAGPFGAGKTTVLVRLALLFRKEVPGAKIWVVNADSLRGGGRLVLKNYSHLCGFEYKEAGNAVEFAAILAAARLDGVDRIFVDLPGLPRGRTMPEMLEHFGMTDPENALHLVVTPHYAQAAVRALADRYVPDSVRNNAGLVWTKLDEADTFGALINIGAASRLPVSAFSCGAELNDTLAPAESAALWRLLFKREMPCKIHPDGAGF